MAENTEPIDDRSTREVGTDILVRLARIEGLLDGFLLGLGARGAAAPKTDTRPE
jgi:hypothetical protein